MPSPLHYMPLHHRDWMSSSKVQMMSITAEGIFFRLCLVQWEDEAIPADETKLMRLTRASKQEWSHFKEWLEECFPVCEDGLRRNPRVSLERENAEKLVSKNRENGAKGGRPPKTQPEPKKNPPVNSGLSQTEPNQNLIQSKSKNNINTLGGNTQLGNSSEPETAVVRMQFRPPTGLEVIDFFSTLGFTGQPAARSAERFVNHHAGKRWRGVEDWKPLAKNWADEDRVRHDLGSKPPDDGTPIPTPRQLAAKAFGGLE